MSRLNQFQPQLDGSSLTSTGLTAGAGLWRQVSVDAAFVHQSIAGLLAASLVNEISTGVQTLKRADENQAVFNRVIVSTTVRF